MDSARDSLSVTLIQRFTSGQVVVEQSQAEALAAAAAAGDSLICQAIINSGIALETEEAVVEEASQVTEEVEKVDSDCPDSAEGIAEIQVKEEFVELEMETEVWIRHFLYSVAFKTCFAVLNFYCFIFSVSPISFSTLLPVAFSIKEE